MNKQAFIEAAKELVRVLIFAAMGWALAYVTALPENTTTAVVLLLLRALDKYIHKSEVKANGLIPF